MKKLAAILASLFTPMAFANVLVCQGDAASCLPANWDLSALEQIHFAEQGAGVTSAVGLPQGAGAGLYTVDFTSNEAFNHGAGFATLTAVDSLLNDLTFAINPDDTFGIEVAQFDLLNTGQNGSALAIANFAWLQSDGATGGASGFAMGAGINTFTVWADPETLAAVTMTSLQGFEVAQFKHLRIDPDLVNNGPGPNPTGADAPGVMALLGLGLIGLGVGRQRRR